MLNDKDRNSLIRIVNNSLVGTTKLLHFINSQTYSRIKKPEGMKDRFEIPGCFSLEEFIKFPFGIFHGKLRRAKENGKRLGRPKRLNLNVQELQKMRNQGLSFKKIGERVKACPATIYQTLRRSKG